MVDQMYYGYVRLRLRLWGHLVSGDNTTKLSGCANSEGRQKIEHRELWGMPNMKTTLLGSDQHSTSRAERCIGQFNSFRCNTPLISNKSFTRQDHLVHATVNCSNSSAFDCIILQFALALLHDG